MNRKLVLRVLLLVSLLYELMILAGCSNEVVGKLSVRISDANSRGVNSSTPMDVDHYILTLYDKDHKVITDHILYPSVSVVDFSLEPGEYILQVEAKNEYGFIIGEGYRDAEVVAGERNCVTINVTEVEGYGEFNVFILANRGPDLKLVIYDDEHEIRYEEKLNHENGFYFPDQAVSLMNGFYVFEIIRTDNNKVIERDTLRIVKSSTSTYEATFTFYSDGSLSIVNEIPVLPSIEITLNKSSFSSTDTLLASAVVSGLEGFSACWLVDDVAYGSYGVYGDLSLDLAGFDAGNHEIMFLVMKGALIWSESEIFTIEDTSGERCLMRGTRTVHSWKATDVIPPTHEDGLTTFTCLICGETKDVVTERVKDHIWAEDWSIETRDGHKLQYKDCTVPGCSERLYFGAQYAEYFNVDENGVLTVKDGVTLPSEIKIPTVVGDRVVTEIGYRAFAGITTLTDVDIPLSVNNIGDSAFNKCSGLSRISIPESVTDIGNGAFQYCSGLTKISIPSGVTVLEGLTFFGCKGLTSVDLPADLTEIGYNAFTDCSGLTHIDIPSKVTSIRSGAFSHSGLKSITIPSNVESLENNVFETCYSLTSVGLPAGLNSIGDNAFNYCFNLTDIEIPAGVTTIGTEAFSGCVKVESFTIPSGLTSLGSKAFCGCKGLTSVSIPVSLTQLGEGAFKDSGVTTAVFEEGWTEIPAGALMGCKSLTSVTIPSGVTSIGKQAFRECSSLAGISLPDTVVSIGKESFYKCESLSSITIPDNLIVIGEDAFSYCSSLSEATIPSGVETISNGAFSYCTSLSDVTISSGVKVIGFSAFYCCSGLKRIEIPDSVTTLSQNAFMSCGLTDISFSVPSGLTTVGYGAFEDCKMITVISIPSGVTLIDDYAFYKCLDLESITIPDTVTTIGNRAFEDCNNLSTIGFTGTTAEWNEVMKGNAEIPETCVVQCSDSL